MVQTATRLTRTQAAALRQRAVNIRSAERALFVPADDGAFVHDRITALSGRDGRVTAANASLLTEGFYSEPMTTFAVGYRDPNDIAATLEFFSPAVPAPRRFEYSVFDNAEEFLSDDADDDLRAPRSDFKEAEYTSDKVPAVTQNRGLKITVDLDQIGNLSTWRQDKTAKLIRRLRRNALRRSIALLSAASVGITKQWDTTAGCNPDQDVRAQLRLASDNSGIRPTRVGYGDSAWDARITAYEGQNNAGGNIAANKTIEQMAARLNVDQVGVSRERFQQSNAAKAEVLGLLVLLFNARSGMDLEDASNIKRFVSEVDGGGYLRVYERQISAKLYEIVVEHYELIKIVSLLGLRKLAITAPQ